MALSRTKSLQQDVPTDVREHFRSYPECHKFFEDPSLFPVRNIHRAVESNVLNTFMIDTLQSADCIRSAQSFYRFNGHAQPLMREELWTLYSIGNGSQGATGIFHGGLVFTLLDQQTASLLVANPDMVNPRTVYCNIRYRKSIAVPGAVLSKSWITRAEGRKIWATAVLESVQGVTMAETETLFVISDVRL